MNDPKFLTTIFIYPPLRVMNETFPKGDTAKIIVQHWITWRENIQALIYTCQTAIIKSKSTQYH